MKNGRLIISMVLASLILSLFSVNASAADVKENRFYSIYTPVLFNRTPSSLYYPQPQSLQVRMNCYGYVLRVYYNGTLYGYNSYSQQPGCFASAANRNKVIDTEYIDNRPNELMDSIVSNMRLDAERLGFDIVEYTVPPSGEVTQVVSGARMIALVAGNTDYHFYMQHSDGTWSHKPGSGPVTNLSMDDNEPLTNQNIVSKAAQEKYTGGVVKFFLITKDAVIDCPHGDKDPLTNEIPLCFADVAGESPTTSSQITTGTLNGNMDFLKDIDTFSFMPSVSVTYRFSTTCPVPEGNDLDISILDSEGATLINDFKIGNVDFTYSMTAGQKYYIQLYNAIKEKTSYTLTIQKV